MVKKELERLQLPEGSEAIAEPWPYGSDETESKHFLPSSIAFRR